MIPYFEWHTLSLGFIDIQVWGTLVALGFVIGAAASANYAKNRGLDPKILWDTLVWVVIGAFILARFFHVVAYEPGFYLEHPLKILSVWEGGLSVIGGFVGATLFGIWYLQKRKVNVIKYFEAGLFGLPLGLFIGRLGCFFIHDHPGSITNFFLGVNRPDGLARHDLGLYLSINGLLLFIAFLLMTKQKVKSGVLISTFLIWYGVVRFGLDFLRETNGVMADTRYLGLTPAQYFSILMLALGIWWFAKGRKKYLRG